MIKKIVIAVMCMGTIGIYAQNGTVSPYSYFGIGELRSSTTVENQMMGGIGVFVDSIHVNLQNPAALAKMGVQFGEDFGNTTYTAGVSHKRLGLKSATGKENNKVTNLDYLAIAMSLKKGLGIGMGIMPYSSVGYNLVSQSENTNGALVTNRFFGEGGLNKVYFSIGYELFKDVSLGVTSSFNFGTLENNRVQNVEDVQFGTIATRESRINGMDFNYALNYTPTINDKYTLFASVRVNSQANLTSKNTQRIGSFSSSTGQDIEVVEVDLAAQGLKNTELKIPTRTTLGLGFGENRKWFLGGEYSFQSLESFSNDFIDAENLVYENASSFALGGFFVPNASAFSGYLNRITYRAGVRADRTGMIVNGQEINNFGITFGFGLPMRGSFSNLNIGFELGKRGTTDAELIEEDYVKINVGLSLNDMWFRKRKIN